jgi:hypothetical protein
MAYAIGFALAVGLAAFARVAGLDRHRAYYATLVIVVAHYYVLFAVIGGDAPALAKESIGLIVFACAAVLGFRVHPAILMIGLASHGVFDALHGHIIANAGVPHYWPAFCGTFDVVAAACMPLYSVRYACHPRSHHDLPRPAAA